MDAPFKPMSSIPASLDADQGIAQARGMIVTVPEHLHPDTKRLVQSFAEHLALKLRDAEIKYGHRDGWLRHDWEHECRKQFAEHMAKGDPRDVAIYCAFMWARSTALVTEPPSR